MTKREKLEPANTKGVERYKPHDWRDDVIVSPNDPRAVVGRRYYFGDSPAYLRVPENYRVGTLAGIDPSVEHAFIKSNGTGWSCIRPAEPERLTRAEAAEKLSEVLGRPVEVTE